MAVFIPTYFSPLSQYSAILSEQNIVFEVHDNFQKQTYRNRCYIYGANGKQLLNIPIKHNKTINRKLTKDTLIDNNVDWQKQHLKSLQTAYRASPFFEFYEDDLIKIFEKKYTFLQDINIDTFLFVSDALQFSQEFNKTESYMVALSDNDYRDLAIAKNNIEPKFDVYTQMFDHKHGFINNLSILDLLFMEGNNSITFLEKIS